MVAKACALQVEWKVNLYCSVVVNGMQKGENNLTNPHFPYSTKLKESAARLPAPSA